MKRILLSIIFIFSVACAQAGSSPPGFILIDDLDNCPANMNCVDLVGNTKISGTELTVDGVDVTGGGSSAITENTTLYIETTGSDSTGTGTELAPFASVNGALEYLEDKIIATGAVVTIQVGDGHYTDVETIYPRHPNGDRIIITGENYYDISLTSIQSSSGSAGSWSVVLNVSDVSNVETGDYILVYSTSGGSLNYLMNGCWEVTNVDSGNTRITVTNTSRYGTAPSGAVEGTVKVLKSVLTFFEGESGIVVINGNTILLESIALVGGNGTQYGIQASVSGSVAYSDYLKPIGISNFNTGVFVTNHSIINLPQYSSISNCFRGVLTNNNSIYYVNYPNVTGNSYQGVYLEFYGAVYLNNGVVVGNGNDGIIGTYNSTIRFANGVSSYNTGKGIAFYTGGSINMPDSTIVYNGGGGISCQRNATIYAYQANVSNNTGTGIYASSAAYVYAISATVSSNTTNLSPAANTQGNEYGYIDQ